MISVMIQHTDPDLTSVFRTKLFCDQCSHSNNKRSHRHVSQVITTSPWHICESCRALECHTWLTCSLFWFMKHVKNRRSHVTQHAPTPPSNRGVRNKPTCSLFQSPGWCHPNSRYDGAAEPAGGADLLRSHQHRLQRPVTDRTQQTDAWVWNRRTTQYFMHSYWFDQTPLCQPRDGVKG